MLKYILLNVNVFYSDVIISILTHTHTYQTNRKIVSFSVNILKIFVVRILNLETMSWVCKTRTYTGEQVVRVIVGRMHRETGRLSL